MNKAEMVEMWLEVYAAVGEGDISEVPDDVLEDEELLLDAVLAALADGYDLSDAAGRLGLLDEDGNWE